MCGTERNGEKKEQKIGKILIGMILCVRKTVAGNMERERIQRERREIEEKMERKRLKKEEK